MADQWDNALTAYLQVQGAQSPRILDKQPYAPQQYIYVVAANSWEALSQFGAGSERTFTVWADGQGNANVGEVGLNLP